MRQLVALLALLWAALNLWAAYALLVTGVSGRIVVKGPLQQALPLLAGLALAVFGLLLVWECLRLAASRSA